MAGVVGGDIAENKDESYSAKDWQDVTAFVQVTRKTENKSVIDRGNTMERERWNKLQR